MSSSSGVMAPLEPRPVERFGWTLLPLALIAYGAGFLYLASFLAQAWMFADSIGSTAPVLLQLHPTFPLPAAVGTLHYLSGAYIADGATITSTGVRADVSGVHAATRMLLKLDPLLWSATLCGVTTAIGLTLARLRARTPDRPASRPMLVAAIVLGVGSTAAQLVAATALTQIGHVTWDGKNGITGFTATPDQLFDLTPIGAAAAFLAIVLTIRRSEPTPPPASPHRSRPPATDDSDLDMARRADAEGAWS